MRKITFTMILFSISFLAFCSNSGYKRTAIDPKTFEIQRMDPFQIKNIGRLKQIVPLETTEDSLLADARFIKTDTDGNWYVADPRSGQKVCCFDKNGKFLRRFGKRGLGPGEVHNLHGFDLTSKGDVVLVADTKLLKFDKNGTLTKEMRVKPFFRDICIINDLIYLSPVRYRDASKHANAVLVLDENFKEVGGLAPYDERLLKYLNLPLNVFARHKDTLYFLDYYDFTLNIYDVKSNDIRFVRFPSNNDKMARSWRKAHMADSDIELVRNTLHRFERIFCSGDQLFLYEFSQEKDLADFWVLNPTTKKAIVYPFSKMSKVQKYFFFSIAGAMNNNVIIVFDADSEETMAMYKAEFPILKDITYDMEANPILGIFEFNEVK